MANDIFFNRIYTFMYVLTHDDLILWLCLETVLRGRYSAAHNRFVLRIQFSLLLLLLLFFNCSCNTDIRIYVRVLFRVRYGYVHDVLYIYIYILTIRRRDYFVD